MVQLQFSSKNNFSYCGYCLEDFLYYPQFRFTDSENVSVTLSVFSSKKLSQCAF